MMATNILRQAPIGTVGEAVREIELDFSFPLSPESARDQDNYRLTYLGSNGVAGGGDDVVLPVLPQYVDGSTMLRLSTLADLSSWTETDYGFPRGILGDWQLDAATGSVVQGVNGGATFFTSDVEFIDREFAAQIEVDTSSDDDFIGVVFGLRSDSSTELPESYYLLAWKKAQAGGSPGGLRLARISGTGELGERPDLWQLSDSDPHIDLLATGPGSGWASGIRYDFRVLQESNGSITLSVKNAETGANIWSTSVVDPNPLGRGKVGFYNFSQANVRHWNLRTTGSLPQGAYQIEVFASEAGGGLLDFAGNPVDGNSDADPGDNYVGAFNVNIGTPTVALDLQSASDSGVSASDNLTNDKTPSFDIATNRSGLVEVFVDGALDPSASLAFSNAETLVWTASALADGVHAIRVRFTPDLGNSVELTLNVKIDTAGPYLLPGTATEQAPLYSRQANFSEPVYDSPGASLFGVIIDPQLNFVGQVQASVSGTDAFTIPTSTPQISPGLYVVEFTALIDRAGNAPDQDRDGTNGESDVDVPAEFFTLVADAVRPQVTSFSPQGLIKRPLETMRIGFGEEINPATFTPSDVTVTGPSETTIPAIDEILAVDATHRQFDIVFASPLAFDGAFTVTVGPDIRDLSGNALAAAYTANFQIALPPPIPAVPGDGVFIELFNGIGGGTTPTPASLNGLTPDGTTLSPQIDFPRPGAVINVGDNFVNFFANTTTPPDAVVNLSAANFTLRNTFFVAISADMDRNILTPEIDVQFGVGSDDGFYLTIDDRFVGSAGDRGFGYSWFNFVVESPGLFPVELLYAANAVGQSGLEFAWNTAISGGNQVIPQQYLYVSPLLGDQKITFEELPAGTAVTDQYRDRGVLFNAISGNLQVTSENPTEFVPVSPTRVFADPSAAPTALGEVDLTFVVPDTNNAGTTNFVSMYLIDAETVGATVTAFDPEGNVIFSQTIHEGGASQKQVVIQRDRIARVNVTLGQGGDTSAIDNISFNTPSLLNSPPVIAALDDKTVDEETLLSFTVNVADPDLPSQTLTFSLGPGAPTGASINPTSGAFTWTPSETQGPGSYPITVVVRDSGTPRLRDEDTFIVTVQETNKAPTLPVLGDRTVTIDAPVSFLVGGADADVPVQSLTYSLEAGAPAWAAVHPTSGLFTASVTGAVPDGSYPVTVRITDNGAGALSATRQFNLIVDNNRPNLVAQDIAAAGPLTPGAAFTLNWKIDNIGSESASGSWTERIYVSNSPTGANRQQLASFTYSGPLAPNDPAASRSEPIALPLTSLNGAVYFVVEVDATNNVVESDENNLFVSASSLMIPAALALSFAGSSVAEGGASVQGTLTRNGDVSQPLNVTLTPSFAGQLTLPATVTIPAGQYTQRFDVSATDNTLVETSQVVEVQATAVGFTAAAASFTVLDNDQPHLVVTFPTTSIAEGQTARGRVTRDLPAVQDLLINVVSSDNAQLSVPLGVVLPAGQSFVEFDIMAVDDALLERLASYTVSINSPGHLGSSLALAVPQNDVPSLTLTLLPMLPEGAAGPTVFGTITRSVASSQAVVVELASNNPALVGVPATVTIPADAASVTFPIQIADDDLVNGSRSADITARILPTAGGAPFVEGAATATQGVIDNDGPTLSVIFNRDTVAEGASATATIRRNTSDLSQALAVTLESSDATELTTPGGVIIPAGASSVVVSVSGVEDDEVDGDQPVVYMAKAPGFNTGSASIIVVDIDLADLVVSSLTAPATAFTNSTVNVTWSVANNGYASAEGTWTERVYVSRDNRVGDDTLAGQYTFTGPLGEGQSYNRNVPVRLPNVPGDYWIVVEVDVANAVSEGLETNNARITQTPTTVTAAYTANVMTDVVMAPADTPVLLTGMATNVGDGSPAAFQQVSVHLSVRGTKRVLPAVTDANGNFRVTFNPLPGEGGTYTVGAAHPGLADAPVQDTFKLVGMRAEPPSRTITVTEGNPAASSDSVTIRNLADVPLTGLAVQVLDAPPNLEVTATLAGNATTLAAMGTVVLTYSVRAADASVEDGTIRLRITSNEAPDVVVPVGFQVIPLVSRLVVDPGTLNKSMLVGDQTSVEFTVTNTGGKATGQLTVLLPTGADWLTLATSATIPSLSPGASASVTLLLTPPQSLPLTAYNGSLVVRGDATQVAIPFSFRAVSDQTGDLEITVVDEFFFFAEDEPLVTDATVILRDAITGEEIASSSDAAPPANPGGPAVAAAMLPPTVTIDDSGRVKFAGVTEGFYKLEVRSDNHDTFSETIRVSAGETNAKQIFVSRNLVKYTWNVEEIEIEDRTRITIDAVFETNVPAPVVTVDGVIDLADLKVIGQTQQFDIKLTNHGLIAANDVMLNFGTHPFYEITPLIQDIGVLPAKSEIVVPVVVKRVADFESEDEAALAIRGSGLEALGMVAHLQSDMPAMASTSVPCAIFACAGWTVVCGVKIPHCTIIPVTNVDGNCPPGSFTPIFIGGETGDFGPGPTIHVSEVEVGRTKDCPDCLGPAIIGCALGAIPGVGSILSCGYGIYDTSSKNQWISYGGAATVIGCIPIFGPVSGCIIGLAGCLLDELNSPSNGQNALALGLQAEAATAPSWADEYLEVYDAFTDYLEILFGTTGWINEFTGDANASWISRFGVAATEGSPDGRGLSEFERQQLLDGELPEGVSLAQVGHFLDRWQRTIDYWDVDIVDSSETPSGGSQDFLARDVVVAAFMRLDTAYAALVATGALGSTTTQGSLEGEHGHGHEAAVDPAGHDHSVQTVAAAHAPGELHTAAASLPGGICAQVRIQIEQQAVLTRQGFRATLGISNPVENVPLEDLNVDVLITDASGKLVNHLFSIQAQFTPVAGGVGVAPGEATELSWIIIPKDTAAPVQNTTYFVGGRFTYVEGGVHIFQELAEDAITVVPQPALDLDYFLQRDVISDDPHTEAIEPAKPFTLAVIVQNNGAGPANNLRIESAQPKIIENEKGLLIDFEITGTKVNGGEVQRSLTANFGTVNPGSLAIAEWQMESTLQGLFVEYDATFEHISGLGDEQLSLVKSVQIHELIHVVNAGQADGGDGLPDFLVNDITDVDDLPDTLYLSNGSTVNVGLGVGATVDAPPVLGDLRVAVSATMLAGWSYLKMADPGLGDLALIGVQRSDGTMLPAENFWQTDRTFIGGGQRPALEDNIHVLDFNSTGSYTFIFSNGDLIGPEVVSFSGVVPNPTTQAIDVVDVTFTERLADATFTGADVTLTKNGAAVALSELTIAHVSGSAYRISGLAPFTSQDAVYELKVNAPGVTDEVGNAGVGMKTYRWVKGETAPTVLSLIGAPSGLVTEGPASIDVVFSKPVLGFEAADVTLTRGGGANLIDAQVTIAQVGERTYRVGNLARLTGPDGVYQFSVNAAGVQDGVGNVGLGLTTVDWTLDATAPQLLDLFDPPTNPRNIVVQQIDVEFSEPIDLSTFSVDDLRLVRNGGALNLIAGDGRVMVESRGNNIYRVKGINWVQAFIADPQIADFTLTVDATGIRDLAGNPAVGVLSSTWTLDLDKPLAATDLALSTFSGPVIAGMVNARQATVSGMVAEAGLTVAIRDMTTDTDLVRKTIPGTTFSLPIEFPSAGQHRLRVRVIDPAGNTTDDFIENLFVSETPPVLDMLLGLPNERTRNPVDFIDLKFLAPIDSASLTKTALTITRNGGANLVNGTVFIVAQPDGKTFRFTGLSPITGDEGRYDFHLDLTGVKNGAGLTSTEMRTTSWINDHTAPTSSVRTLEFSQELNSFIIDLDGSDPSLPGNLAPSGLVAFDLYYSDNGAPFQLLQTLPAISPTTTFVGEPNHIYYFRSVARDAAGNIEAKPNRVDAWTYVPDLFAPDTEVHAVDVSDATLDASFMGTDRGAGLQSFELFVQVDGGSVQSVGVFSAGAPDAEGMYTGTASYQAIADGNFHEYRFFTVGTDWQDNRELAPDAPADVTVNARFNPPAQTNVVDFDVQKGATQRSYIRYLDVFFNTSNQLSDIVASLADGNSANDRIRVTRFGLDGAGPGTGVDLKGRVNAVDLALAIDFGADGLGGDRYGTAGDGYYKLALDLDGNGSLETELAFFRLVGDVEGDGDVDNMDLAILNASLGQVGANLDGDINGDGRVNALDRQVWQRGRGRFLAAGLPLND